MNRVLKIILYFLALVVVLIIIAGLYINFKSPTVYENKAPDITVEFDSSMIAEGQRMANVLCNSCHGGEDGKLSGQYMPDIEMFGKVYAPNITHHETSKLNGYTDGELIYLFRTGIKRDGLYAPPWMAKFPIMSDRDINCIIAFLRSDNRLLEPSTITQPAPQPNFLAKFLTLVAFKPLPYPENPIPEPDTSDKVKWGEYLSTAKFDCFSCHSLDFAKVNLLEPSKSTGFFGGGNHLLRRDGTPILSPNITMDKEAGIGTWTKEEFVKTVRFGERKSGIATEYPMLPFSDITEVEVGAIWEYLQTVPKISIPVVNEATN